MSSRVFNFGPGPAMLPTAVMERAQREFLNYRGMGVSVVELSHRSPEFIEIIDRCNSLFRELSGVPDNFKIFYMHGGARMQFASIPMNLMPRVAKPKALYFETGNFAKLARVEAERYGEIIRVVDGESCDYSAIPEFDPAAIDQDAAYAHLTSNNTIYGTRWMDFPDTGDVPLVVDATSELLSRKMDYNQFGLVYAGLQKNLGPSGVAMMVVREDLLGHAMPHTPTMLDFKVSAEQNSLANTTNTFAIYLLMCVLEWLKEQGGVAAMEVINEKKAKILYDVLDNSDFYTAVAHPDFRSTMNVSFHLPDNNVLVDKFITEALTQDMYALKGHALVGGLRASIYNSMPIEGVERLADFMNEFERKNG